MTPREALYHLVMELGPVPQTLRNDNLSPKEIRLRDAVSTLQRLIDEMKRRGYADKTIKEYSGSLRRLAKHFGCCPSTLTPEQIREYQLDLARRKDVSWSYYNSTVTAVNGDATPTI